ncbi:MAG: nuclear transport factor 2 family protein, partial [bacterium]|nr:nuclear transport factor 2 family protein [bacterium]
EYAKILDNNKKNEKFVLMVKNGKKKIIYIDITEDAASAKVEILLENVKFTDYYNLVKTGDDWVIVNKIWNAFRLK